MSEPTGRAKLHPRSRALLLSLARQRTKALVGVSVILVSRSAVATLVPVLVKVAIDDGIPRLVDGDGTVLVSLIVAALVLMAVLQAVFDYFSITTIGRVGQDMLLDLRRRVFAHVQRLGMGFHERYTSGRVIARLTSDIESIDELLSQGIGMLAWALLTVVTTSVALFFLDWQLALVVAAFTPIVWLLSRWFRINSLDASRRKREAAALVIVHFVESLRGIAAVQAFRRESRNEHILRHVDEPYQLSKQRMTRLNAIYGPAVQGLGTFVVAAVLAVGGLRVIDGALTVGTLAAFVLYLRRMIDPLLDMSQFYTLYQGAAAALEKLALLLDEKPELPEPKQPVILAESRGEVDMREVRFAYRDAFVLDGFDLHIPAGQTIALLGETGAGKSTVARLIAHLYDPTSGSVNLDGVDLRDIDPSSLHQNIVMVTQENFLFSQTVRENIAFGRPDATDEQIAAAARAIGADSLIDRLDQGYSTLIGKRGSHLSAGERQLLSFARAFIADPKVLILDEATSSLDIPTERLVQSALEKLLANRTAIVIAHRLSTVEIADRVIVLDAGRIVEDGAPADLAKDGGPYRRLLDEWQRSLA